MVFTLPHPEESPHWPGGRRRLPGPDAGSDPQADDMAWEVDDSFNGYRHRNGSSSTTADEITFDRSAAAFGAQFDCTPAFPDHFEVSNGRRDLLTQTAPPFRTTQAQVSDYRAYHTDSFVGHRQVERPLHGFPAHDANDHFVSGTGPAQNELGSGFREKAQNVSNDFPEGLGGKIDHINDQSSYDFFANAPMDNFSRSSEGNFHGYLPFPVHTPGAFELEPVKPPPQSTVNPAYLMQGLSTVSTLDSSWTAFSADFEVPSQQELALRPKSNKRRRKMHEDVSRSVTPAVIQQKQKKPVIDVSGEAVVSAEAAAMFETWLSKFQSIYPEEKHFQALTTLTEENVDAVKLWFAQRLRRGQATSVESIKAELVSPGAMADLKLATPEKKVTQMSPQASTGITSEAAAWVRDRKGTKCIAVTDNSKLQRNPARPYQCTLKCPQNFEAKDDWRKHEEVNFPQEGWICDLEAVVNVDGRAVCCFCKIVNPSQDHLAEHHGRPLCHEKEISDRGRLFHRKQHYWQHIEKIHPGVPRSQFLASSHFIVESRFSRRCGFCSYKPSSWKDRIEHIGSHFTDFQDVKDMSSWRDGEDEENDDDEEENDKEKDADDDDEGGFNDRNDEFPDDESDSSDDDSDGPAPPGPKQHSDTHSEYKNPYQGYNLAVPTASSPSIGGISSLFKGDAGSSLGQSTALKRFSVVSLAEERVSKAGVMLLGGKLLGVGPYSVVDEVQDIKTGLIFARKTIQSANLAESHSLNNEVEIMKRLRHSHIVQFICAYETGSSFSILMNPSADYDLGYYMETHVGKDCPAVDTVLQWFSCLVSSVEYLHGQSVKHQDIKPSNILLKDGTIMLADFGIAKTFSDSESTSSTAGAMTRKYCAPETTLLGVRGRSADIFSLGCVLLEMFSFLIYVGEPPFKAYQMEHFSGDHAYHENTAQLKDWVGLLKDNYRVTSIPDLGVTIKTIEPMLNENRSKRPTAIDLSTNFRPRSCCFLKPKECSEAIMMETRSENPIPVVQLATSSAAVESSFPWSIPASSSKKVPSTYNIKSISPTASPESTPHSSRRNSHWDSHIDPFTPSFISTPRTSLGSLYPLSENEKSDNENFLVGSYDSAYCSEIGLGDGSKNTAEQDNEPEYDVPAKEQVQFRGEKSREAMYEATATCPESFLAIQLTVHPTTDKLYDLAAKHYTIERRGDAAKAIFWMTVFFLVGAQLAMIASLPTFNIDSVISVSLVELGTWCIGTCWIFWICSSLPMIVKFTTGSTIYSKSSGRLEIRMQSMAEQTKTTSSPGISASTYLATLRKVKQSLNETVQRWLLSIRPNSRGEYRYLNNNISRLETDLKCLQVIVIVFSAYIGALPFVQAEKYVSHVHGFIILPYLLSCGFICVASIVVAELILRCQVSGITFGEGMLRQIPSTTLRMICLLWKFAFIRKVLIIMQLWNVKFDTRSTTAVGALQVHHIMKKMGIQLLGATLATSLLFDVRINRALDSLARNYLITRSFAKTLTIFFAISDIEFKLSVLTLDIVTVTICVFCQLLCSLDLKSVASYSGRCYTRSRIPMKKKRLLLVLPLFLGGLAGLFSTGTLMAKSRVVSETPVCIPWGLSSCGLKGTYLRRWNWQVAAAAEMENGDRPAVESKYLPKTRSSRGTELKALEAPHALNSKTDVSSLNFKPACELLVHLVYYITIVTSLADSSSGVPNLAWDAESLRLRDLHIIQTKLEDAPQERPPITSSVTGHCPSCTVAQMTTGYAPKISTMAQTTMKFYVATPTTFKPTVDPVQTGSRISASALPRTGMSSCMPTPRQDILTIAPTAVASHASASAPIRGIVLSDSQPRIDAPMLSEYLDPIITRSPTAYIFYILFVILVLNKFTQEFSTRLHGQLRYFFDCMMLTFGHYTDHGGYVESLNTRDLYATMDSNRSA